MNKIIKCNILLVLISLLSGCFSYAPSNNAPFIKIEKLKQLNGIYKNLGIDGLPHSNAPNAQAYYLSKIIWEKDKKINHEEINVIQVKAIGKNKLSIKAVSNNKIIKEEIFSREKDFPSSVGQVKLESTWGVPLPIVGIGYIESKIGIDQRKNGKYKKNTTVCGLFALLIPMFFTVNEEVRFQRLDTDR